VNEERNVLEATKTRKANYIGYILRRNRFPKHNIEGNIERRIKVTGPSGRRRKQLLGGLKKRR
jgi:hypothetical protein